MRDSNQTATLYVFPSTQDERRQPFESIGRIIQRVLESSDVMASAPGLQASTRGEEASGPQFQVIGSLASGFRSSPAGPWNFERAAIPIVAERPPSFLRSEAPREGGAERIRMEGPGRTGQLPACGRLQREGGI